MSKRKKHQNPTPAPKKEERSEDTANKLQIAAALLGLALKVFEVIEKILDKLD